ncbi:MAG: glycosyltransferase family 4 protein [Anaerolineales bacterium]|nr:glycosyltransferase family 4 protein [Chloroflexota bacterium]MBL6979836.1 glycosyltransferase family 4 protein [Anaerolineales bacterium]
MNFKKQRILICRSNPIVPDPRVEKTVKSLAEAGYNVAILCWDRTGRLPVGEVVNGVPCTRLPIKAQYGSGMENFLPLFRWQWMLFRWLIIHKNDYDLIHACDFDTVLAGMIVKRLFGKKVIYDIFDFYADHLRATPNWTKNIIRAVDLWVINHVDGLIVTDDARWEQISIEAPKNSAVIYNTPQDTSDLFGKQDQPSPSRGLQLVYVGLLQVERGLLDILSILNENPNWHLDLAGFGGDEELILEKAGKMENVQWHGRIPYQRALELTHGADVILALYDPALPNHRYASPNKLFEAMMLGKPIVVAAKTNIDSIVLDENCGLVIEYGGITELRDSLLRLDADLMLRRKLGANGRRAYETKYSWVEMKKRLLDLYGHMG